MTWPRASLASKSLIEKHASSILGLGAVVVDIVRQGVIWLEIVLLHATGVETANSNHPSVAIWTVRTNGDEKRLTF